jgi:vacuolar-type H+-ATPase subunit F/Vma7
VRSQPASQTTNYFRPRITNIVYRYIRLLCVKLRRRRCVLSKILLSVGTNHSLLGIRNLVFATAGYEVLPARSAAQALKAIKSRHLDVVVVGHSLSRSLQQQIVKAAKEKTLPVIVLHFNSYEEHFREADANLCSIDGAAQVVEVLSDLLKRKRVARIVPLRGVDCRFFVHDGPCGFSHGRTFQPAP